MPTLFAIYLKPKIEEKLTRSLTQYQLPFVQRYLNLWLVFCRKNLMCTILGSEILNVHAFSLNASLEMHFCTSASKRDLLELSLLRMVSISVELTTNKQQASGFKHRFICITECSLSHLWLKCPTFEQNPETATKQRNILMDDIYLDTRDCTPKDEFAKQATHDKSHIFCPFQEF